MKKSLIKKLALISVFMQIVTLNVFANPLEGRANILKKRNIYTKPKLIKEYIDVTKKLPYSIRKCKRPTSLEIDYNGILDSIKKEYSVAVDLSGWGCLNAEKLKELTKSQDNMDNSAPLLALRAQERRISEPLLCICDNLGLNGRNNSYTIAKWLKQSITSARNVLYISKVAGASYEDYMYCYFETMLDVVGQLFNFKQYYWDLNLIRAEIGSAMSCLLLI